MATFRRLACVIAVAVWVFCSQGIAYAIAIDFDGYAAGTIITVVSGVQFQSDTGFDLTVSDLFETTSGTNYLGVNDGGFEVFLPGDVITLTFEIPIHSLSVSFISSPNTPSNAFRILTPLGSSVSSSTPLQILSDGGEVFPVGLFSPVAFSIAYLVSSSIGVFSYNIDDVAFAILEPPSWLDVLTGVTLTLVIIRRNRHVRLEKDRHGISRDTAC